MSWLVPLAAASVAGHWVAGPWLPPAAAIGLALASCWCACAAPRRLASPALLLLAAAFAAAAAAAYVPARLSAAGPGSPGAVVGVVAWRWSGGGATLVGVEPAEVPATAPRGVSSVRAAVRLRAEGDVAAAPGGLLLLPERAGRAAWAAGPPAADRAGDDGPGRPAGPVVRVDRGEIVALAPAGGSAGPPWIEGARRHVERSLEARAPPAAARAACSMVLGQGWRLEGSERAALRRIGVSHLLAISGFNLAILAWAVWRALISAASLWRPALVRLDVRRLAACAVAPSAWLVAALAGWQPSVIRAALMITAFLGAQLLDRRATALDALALATIVAYVALPGDADDPGFQLSLAAVAGLLAGDRWGLGGGRRAGADAGRGVGADCPRPTAAGRLISAAGRAVLRLLVASTFAALATAPVAAAHFGQVAPASPLANLVAIPLFTFAVYPLGLLLALAAAGPAPPAAVRAVGDAAAAVWGFFIRLCDGLGAVLPDNVAVGSGRAAAVALFCAACAAVLSRDGRWRRCGCAVLCAFGVHGGDTGFSARPADGAPAPLAPGAVAVTFIDVGDGDAIVVRFADGRVMVIDGGGGVDDGSVASAGRRLIPALEGLGVRSIDWMVATHPHADHYAGLVAASRRFAVGELWTTPQAEAEAPWSGFARWVAEAGRSGARVVRTPEACGVRRIGGVTVAVLAPCGPDGFDPALDENDNSIVLRISVGCSDVLLAADAGTLAEERLLATNPGGTLESEVLKVAHHGSRTGSGAAFLARVRPAVAVVSVGRHGPGHRGPPHRATLDRLAAAGAAIARTDASGSITVHVERDSIRAYDGAGRTLGAWRSRCGPAGRQGPLSAAR